MLQGLSSFFLRDLPAKLYAIAAARLGSLPDLTSVAMFLDIAFLDLALGPLISGIHPPQHFHLRRALHIRLSGSLEQSILCISCWPLERAQ